MKQTHKLLSLLLALVLCLGLLPVTALAEEDLSQLGYIGEVRPKGDSSEADQEFFHRHL